MYMLLSTLIKIVIGSCLVIWLVLAILLNHATLLELDSKNVQSPWILQHYQQQRVETESGFRVGDSVISELNQLLFIDAQPVMTLQRPLIGALELEDIYLVATDDSLILMDKQSTQLLDQLGLGEGIPAQIQNIGLHYTDPILQTRSGMWRGNFLLDSWERVTLEGVSWSTAEPFPAATEAALNQYLLGAEVTVERLLTDIVTGRIIKEYGIWLVDFLLLLMLILLCRGIFGMTGKPS